MPRSSSMKAASLFLPISAVFLFVVSYALAIYYRQTMPLHARFMILTGLPMIDPVLGRILFFYGPPFPNPLVIQAITFGLTDLVVLGLLIWPRMSNRLRPAYGIAAALFVVAHLGWFTFAQSPDGCPSPRGIAAYLTVETRRRASLRERAK